MQRCVKKKKKSSTAWFWFSINPRIIQENVADCTDWLASSYTTTIMFTHAVAIRLWVCPSICTHRHTHKVAKVSLILLNRCFFSTAGLLLCTCWAHARTLCGINRILNPNTVRACWRCDERYADFLLNEALYVLYNERILLLCSLSSHESAASLMDLWGGTKAPIQRTIWNWFDVTRLMGLVFVLAN